MGRFLKYRRDLSKEKGEIKRKNKRNKRKKREEKKERKKKKDK